MNTLSLSEHEWSDKQLTPQTLESAVRFLWDDGYVVLKNVVSLSHIDILKKRTLEDLETILARPDAPFNFNTGNVQQDPPPFAPFLFEDVLLNPFVIQISNAVLGPRPLLGMYSGNTALPGGNRQPVHPDTSQLWPDLQHPTPAFVLVINIPLVDVDARNGGTEFWPGTHHDTSFSFHQGAPRVEEKHLAQWRTKRPPFQVELSRGDIVMRDIRMWHAGMPNQTEEPRPMIAMTHAPAWWASGEVAFARQDQEFFCHPDLGVRARWVEANTDYLHHNVAYDLQR
ncbi:kanamycin B dioxygenase [Abditibacteriota bacterium]|nr:kanamycin B dioxygenase [Abditibacteriota bacterium]